ncbi:hypothetical protein J2T56_003156 [Natronobacillus azotifigens]|uniref:DUF262 domain-containing protein n=1 Tax=Natronobacillus azotifigens TaxID=472978 RepID=A0A9J6RFP1_9BACI|nr:DUF262 domain-containing protein [Natronobacillus azotifigens]MCZ0704586.1 DUF262 domain-containing protein [Natronobacillus azotifigens]
MLLENEKLDFSSADQDSVTLTNDEINEKYQRGEMRIITEQGRYPLQNIKEILSKNMKFNPEYQRRRVWTDIQKSRLIESFIINIPVPPVFLYEIEFSKYEVMDGLQRLSTLYEFYDNKFSLSGLEVWPELNDKRYDQLPDKVQKGIDRRYISTIVILNETAKSIKEEQILKKFVFERLNTGGTKLTDQETRNALFDGDFNTLCMKIARENTTFHKLWKIKPFKEHEVVNEDSEIIEEKERNLKVFIRMEDVELVLRFFAYRQLDYISVTKVKDILDLYLKQANQSYNEEIHNNLEELFNNTLKLTEAIFEDKSFLLFTKRKGEFIWYASPSKLVYDPIMNVLSEYVNQKEKASILIERKDVVIKKMEKLFKSHSIDFNGRNNNKSDVIRRKGLFKMVFEQVLEGK